MIKSKQFYTFAFCILFGSLISHAQTDFQRVYQLMQAKCTTCHGGASPQGNLDLSGNQSSVFDALINKTPTNPAGAAKGNKLIVPGRPDQSFLMRKLAYADWDDYYETLEAAEGQRMPLAPLAELDKHEVELVRQWILHGASFNQIDVPMDAIEEYYTNGGLDFIERPEAPAEGEGFQVRMGPIFTAPGQEFEFFQYYDIDLPEDLEITETEVVMNDEAHHFVLYIANENDDFPSYGLIPIEETNGLEMMNQEDIAAVWQTSHPIPLPEKTAFFWDEKTVLDLNFHAKNYSASLVMPAEAYVNIYTQASGVAEEEMLAQILTIGATSGKDLVIPNGGNLVTITDHIKTNNSFPMYIWTLSSHTHKTGEDYDIYLRNPNGSKGDQIFEGFYNFDYTFNQGFYDWEHPPLLRLEEPIYVNLQQGLIHEAKYINDTDETLYWGFTTEDEMMLFYVHYTENPVSTSATKEAFSSTASSLVVSPNPFNNETFVRYELTEASVVELEIFDMLGKPVQALVKEQQMAGSYSIPFRPNSQISNGLYFAKLTIDGQVATKKFSYLR